MFQLLPNDRIFADDKINVTEKLKFVLGRIQNIVERAAHAGYQNFVVFLQCLQKISFSGSFKVEIVW